MTYNLSDKSVEKKKRIFIQSYSKYPRGGALSNYIENFSKAFSNAGYSIIMITDLNEEYSLLEKRHFEIFDAVHIIKPSDDIEISNQQRKCGFAKERLEAMKQENITQNDVVVVLGIYNEYILRKLFAYRESVGFKLIFGVLELFTLNDYKNPERFYLENHAINNMYIDGNAIISISDFINEHFKDKEICTYKFPPMIDYDSCKREMKSDNKRKFIIPTGKDSFANMLKAFCELSEQELFGLEVHICSVKEDVVREILGEEEWIKLKECVIIHKWMKYEELESLYAQIHFLLIARETYQRTLANFPSKVPETMAYGIVPVVSEVGDYTKYYLEDGKNSIFINGDSVEEIVKSIRKAINLSVEEYICYSEAAIKCARNRFDYRNWLDDVRNMIEGV